LRYEGFPTGERGFCPLQNLQTALGDFQAFFRRFRGHIPPALNLMGLEVYH
jgi:hypothetical protein